MTKTLRSVRLGVWVEAEQDLLVVEWVLLLHDSALGDGTALDWAQYRLHFRTVDELGNIWLRDDVGWEEEVPLELRRIGGAAVDGVEGGECRRGPDDEATEVAAWCELEEVEGVDWASLDACNVAESANKILAVHLWLVNDERTAALLMAAVSQFTLASAQLAGVLDLLKLLASTDCVEDRDGGGGLLDSAIGEGSGGDDERDLWDGGDVVTAGQEEGSAGRSSDGRGSSEALLAKVDLLVPLAPDFGRSEHATRATLVTERGLTSTVSTATRDTRDTSDGTSCMGVSLGSRHLSPSLVTLHVPVPQDSALVWWPAFSLTAYGWRLFLAMPVWTLLSVCQPLRSRVFVARGGGIRTGQCPGGWGP